MVERSVSKARLFDDNPAVEDLLGFDAIADVVARIIGSGGLDPVTVGIHSAWGGGKSTALNLIAESLSSLGHVLVVRIDPWEFENAQDMRGTMIAQVLDMLQSRVPKDDPAKAKFIVDKLNDLRKRIAWGRVAKVLITSAVTMSPKIGDLVDALTPGARTDDADQVQQGMAGFREQFRMLMESMDGLTKVVVLVDDLDRCLPPTIMATLESIKLFLSVKKMAFVIAADQDLIRDAIDVELRGAARGGFARLYTEKIVQLPVTLPMLSIEQAEAYIALLLCNSGSATGERYREIVALSRKRRVEGKAPYVLASQSDTEPTAATLTLAAGIARGLAADVWRSPRAIKRFLNALAVREHLATLAGAELPLELLAKLYLLELRHSEAFQALARQTKAERRGFIDVWEDWAHGLEGAPAPDGVNADTRDWAAHPPSLKDETDAIDRYLSVAATLKSDVRFGGAISAEQLELIELLAHPSDATRNEAVTRVVGLPSDDQDIVVQGLCDQLARTEDPEHLIKALQQITDQQPRLTEAVTTALAAPAVIQALQLHHVPYLAGFPTVMNALATVPGVDDDVVRAAREVLEGGR
ncbi:P-loop NTPase fold protein [Micromonospora sp. NPDC050200]|uniref:KAP family P-loop NTPase fold protein n=1 Tax=Micromonospora sp. NPDC050200 TaxID=3155664 RepID=UPI0033C07121